MTGLQPARTRWAAFLIACLLIVAFAPAFTTLAHAQDAPAGDPPAGAAADGDRGLFMHILVSAGPVFGTLLGLLSITLVTLIVLLSLDLRMNIAIPPEFVATFTDTVNKGQLKEAFALAKDSPSFMAKVMSAGMGRLQYGIDDARDAAMNAVDSIRSSKEQLNNYTAVISSLGPLIGLVGTVYGMILSFKELARPGARVEASKLAEGISHALVITMLGIGLAVPGLFFNAFFRNRITRISMETANISDDLLTQMFHNAKKGGPSAVAQSNAAAAAGQKPTVANTGAMPKPG